MPQAVDLEPKEPKIDNQCGLSQIDAIRASDIWRGRLMKVYSRKRKLKMPETGFEPAREKISPAPQAGASASSATPARSREVLLHEY